jgi:hypothetical protein
MIKLTDEQRPDLAQAEPLAVDPQTQEIYVLVRKAVYERLKAALAEDVVCTSAEMLDRVMAEDDVHDPYLAELQRKYGTSP